MADSKNLTLYGAVDSPFPHRVRLALAEANIPYDLITIDLIDKPEWYEQKVNRNPGGKVPYLVYGGPKLQPGDAPSPDAVTIPESIVILEFLADLYPAARLLPADPTLRARARLFALAVDQKFLMAFAGFTFMGIPVEALLGALELMQSMLPPTGFAVGEWSIADAAFVPILYRLDAQLRHRHELPKEYEWRPEADLKEVEDALASPRFARIRRYLDDNVARPSMAATWDEPALVKKFIQRLERLRKTGKISSELSLPMPQK